MQHETPEGRAVDRSARARAYDEARRHSRRVRFFKIAIPLCAAIGITFVVTVTFFDPFERMTGVTVGPISLSGSKISMESPRLSGYRKDNRGYEVTATVAVQDVRKPNVIELADMKARLALDDNGTMARLEAATGVFDTQREQLELNRDVHVKTDAGQEAHLKSASVDFKAGTVVSREPVTVKMPNGTVEADSLEITESGKVIVFKGRVRSVFEPPSDPPAAAAAAPAPAVPAAGAARSGAQPVSLRP